MRRPISWPVDSLLDPLLSPTDRDSSLSSHFVSWVGVMFTRVAELRADVAFRVVVELLDRHGGQIPALPGGIRRSGGNAQYTTRPRFAT